MITELVKFKNQSGLFLDGLYFYSPLNHYVVIHVHGSFGNFYSNTFIKDMAEIYNYGGINFLSFNLTQHDGIAEAVREKENICSWEYIGYSISDYNSCIDDIAGAIEYVKKRNNDVIVLQGHSLGCNRVLYYIKESGREYPVILLSPTNSLELQRRWIYPETIEHQISRIKASSLERDISYVEHGVDTSGGEINRVHDEVPYIPISGKSLVSMLENQSMDIVKMLNSEKRVANMAFVYLGGSDEYQTEELETYKRCFENYFLHTTYKIIRNGNHSFRGFERELASNIASWVKLLEYDSKRYIKRSNVICEN